MRKNGHLASFIAFLAMVVTILVSAEAEGDDRLLPVAQDEFTKLLGEWDKVGTAVSLEIRRDRTVRHSILGAGDIRSDNANYYIINYRHRHLECNYQVKRYDTDSIAFVFAQPATPSECDLGVLRRVPGSTANPEGLEKQEPKHSSVRQENSVTGTNVGLIVKSSTQSLNEPFKHFKDCPTCPELIAIPPGQFEMGSPPDEKTRNDDEGPVQRITLRRPLAVGKYALTVAEFRLFVTATNYPYGRDCQIFMDGKWNRATGASFLSPGFPQADDHPVVCVSWLDIKAYLKWLSDITGETYRFLSEAEREFVARAGSRSAYWWGEEIQPDLAQFDRTSIVRVGLPGRKTASSAGTVAVSSFLPNKWGLFQVHGNVAEWTEDCWNATLKHAEPDGRAASTGDCGLRVMRGGSWGVDPPQLRSAYRDSAQAADRYWHVGGRVARVLKEEATLQPVGIGGAGPSK